jgi:MscS family membrane protein
MKNIIRGIHILLLTAFSFVLAGQDVFYTQHNPNYSPYHVIYTQHYYLTDDNYDPTKAARAFRGGTQVERERHAIRLKQIMDGRGLRINPDIVPKDQNYFDSVSLTPTYRPFPRQPEIIIEKISGKWYFSESTVQAIPVLHKEVYPLGSDLWVKLLPARFQTQVFGLNTWQWFGILIIIIAGYIVQRALITPFKFIINRISKIRAGWAYAETVHSRQAANAFSYFVTIKVIGILIPTLQFSSKTSQFAVLGINIMAITFIVIFLWHIVDIIMHYLDKKAQEPDSKLSVQMIPIFRKGIKIILIVSGLFGVLSAMGSNPMALLAGLSVGGLAVALAAQETIKNMFGALMIMVDKPFQVGDWIKTDGVEGIVEEIGLRSTRVRSFEDSVVSVPNGKMADQTIDNLGLRNYRRFRTEIAITYDTPPFLIQKYCDGVREILQRHPMTNKDRVTVRLNNMADYSLNILMITFIQTKDIAAERDVKHELYLAFIQLAHKLGVRFAFPTTTLHMETFHQQPTPLETPPSDAKAEESFRQFFREFKPGWDHPEQPEQ